MSPQFQNPLIDLLRNTNYFFFAGGGGSKGGFTSTGQQERAICFATLRQNKLNSDIDCLNSHKSNLLSAFYRSLRGLIGDGCLKEMIVLRMRLHVYLPAPSQPG